VTSFSSCSGLPALVVAAAALIAVALFWSEVFWWWLRWQRQPNSFSLTEALFQFELNIGSLPVAHTYGDEGRFGLVWSLLVAVLFVFIVGLPFDCVAWPYSWLLAFF
jgi:predicted permease